MPKKKTIKGFGGLEYVEVQGVRSKSSKWGDTIDEDYQKLELAVAAKIISKKVPIRGAEVKFLRKVLGLSLEKFAREFDLSSGAIFKWEKDRGTRLSAINEIAVRAFLAEKLKVRIQGWFSDLKANDTTPSVLLLKAS